MTHPILQSIHIIGPTKHYYVFVHIFIIVEKSLQETNGFALSVRLSLRPHSSVSPMAVRAKQLSGDSPRDQCSEEFEDESNRSNNTYAPQYIQSSFFCNNSVSSRRFRAMKLYGDNNPKDKFSLQ